MIFPHIDMFKLSLTSYYLARQMERLLNPFRLISLVHLVKSLKDQLVLLLIQSGGVFLLV